MHLLTGVSDRHLDAVLGNLSPEDSAELVAAGIVDIRKSFEEGLDRSTIWGTVMLDDLTPVAIYGCLPDPNLEGAGIPWMIATPGFRTDHRAAMIFSVYVVERMQGQYTYLHNWVHAEHSTAIRWLTWLGFALDLEPVGPGGQFIHFEWSRLDV